MVGFARSTNILTNLLPFVETFSVKNKVIRNVSFFTSQRGYTCSCCMLLNPDLNFFELKVAYLHMICHTVYLSHSKGI